MFVPYAYAALDATKFGKVLDPIIANIVNPLIWLLFTLGIFFFAYGVIEMIIKGDDPDARKTGRYHMLAGAIGMFIMVSAWGIIRFIANTIGGI